jgi:hypothetical protein
MIPITKNVPSMTQSRVLDGVEYELVLRWNMRGGWFLGLLDESGVAIFQPRQLTVGSELLGQVRYDARTPPGELWVISVKDDDREPGYLDLCSGGSLSDLQGTVALVYVPADEVGP